MNSFYAKILDQWKKYKFSDLKQILEMKNQLNAMAKQSSTYIMKESELQLRDRIRFETSEKNRNNLTRTRAYLDFYIRHPEIRWSFLAHMVSRNAGWNMTDLKGEWLSRLLEEKERNSFYQFLERGNWLIFQDVYPQLLLYEESKKRQSNLFYLLPQFGVSRFMNVMWDRFWKDKNLYFLAIALVINEQNYIEKRVIHNPQYQKAVFDTLEFKLQDLLSLNQLLLPHYDQKSAQPSGHVPVRLSGQTIHHFACLNERIRIGKRLYSLLFADEVLTSSCLEWALANPHTGSRKDYWPRLFNDINESVLGSPYIPRLDGCSMPKTARRFYSPSWRNAWRDVAHIEADAGDWFQDAKVLFYLLDEQVKAEGKIQDEYCSTLAMLEGTVWAMEKASMLQDDGEG